MRIEDKGDDHLLVPKRRGGRGSGQNSLGQWEDEDHFERVAVHSEGVLLSVICYQWSPACLTVSTPKFLKNLYCCCIGIKLVFSAFQRKANLDIIRLLSAKSRQTNLASKWQYSNRRTFLRMQSMQCAPYRTAIGDFRFHSQSISAPLPNIMLPEINQDPHCAP